MHALKVQLYYTDHRAEPPESAIIAEFDVRPPLTGAWSRLTMKLKDDHVTLLVECAPRGTVTVADRATDLMLQDGSTFYVAQAGPEFTDAKFEVIIIIIIIIMFVYWRLSNATNTEQWHNIIA